MRILVAPLDWGLGHATRCVPIIRALRAAGHEVIPCASGAGLRLLRAEFPELDVRELSSYAMRYTKNRALLPLWLLLQLPLFLLSAWRDGRAAARIVRETGADFIVSDGRYGFRCGGGASAKVPAVFVSHQLGIIPPGPRALRALFAPALRALNRRALRGFAEVWVPDFPVDPGKRRGLSSTLGGALAHPPGAWPQARMIYPLCRFRPETLPWDRAFDMKKDAEGEAPPVIDVLALLSGPEPQRTLLEALVIRTFADLPGTKVLVRGVPPGHPTSVAGALLAAQDTQNSGFEISPESTTIFDHLSEERLLACLVGARSVVCRSGYTTMMELAGLGKGGVLLVPTPGQPEQEYLAEHAEASGFAAWQDQDALDIPAGLARARALPGFGVLFTSRHGSDVSEGSPESFDLGAWIRGNPLLRKPVLGQK